MSKYTRNEKGGITDESLPGTDMYKTNKQWADKLIDEDYTVIDIGNPSNKGGSVFYDMEQDLIFK